MNYFFECYSVKFLIVVYEHLAICLYVAAFDHLYAIQISETCVRRSYSMFSKCLKFGNLIMICGYTMAFIRWENYVDDLNMIQSLFIGFSLCSLRCRSFYMRCEFVLILLIHMLIFKRDEFQFGDCRFILLDN